MPGNFPALPIGGQSGGRRGVRGPYQVVNGRGRGLDVGGADEEMGWGGGGVIRERLGGRM